jgi:hypothetical protein
MKSKWRDGKVSAQELIRKTIELLVVSDVGGITFANLDLFHIYLDILISRYCFHKDVPSAVRERFLREGIFDLSRSGQASDSELASIIERNESHYLRQPLAPYTLLSPISIRYGEFMKRISVGAASFTFYPHRPKNFPIPDGGSVSVSDTTPSDYSYLKVHVKARDPWGATENAMYSIDFLRCLWNFYYNRKIRFRDTWISDGGWAPVNSIRPGPIHTLHLPTGKLALKEVWWNSYCPRMMQARQVEASYASLRRFEMYVRRQIRQSKFADMLKNVLLRYGRALDSYDSTTTMLNLWSTLEVLTGVQRSNDSGKLIRRATFLDRNPIQGRLLLEFIREHRNTIAHDGSSPENIERLVFTLKAYVEGLLWFAICNSHKYSSYDKLLHILDMPLESQEILEDIAALTEGLRLRSKLST